MFRGSSQPVLRWSYSVDFGYISIFEVIDIVAAYFVQSCYARGSCTLQIFSLHSARGEASFAVCFRLVERLHANCAIQQLQS